MCAAISSRHPGLHVVTSSVVASGGLEGCAPNCFRRDLLFSGLVRGG